MSHRHFRIVSNLDTHRPLSEPDWKRLTAPSIYPGRTEWTAFCSDVCGGMVGTDELERNLKFGLAGQNNTTKNIASDYDLKGAVC